jgi:predicted PurR-regulated permease PerM
MNELRMNERNKRFNSGRAIFSLLAVITCVIMGTVLKVTAVVFLPFTIALLLAFVLTPIVNFLGKHKIHRGVAIGLVILFIFLSFYFLGAVLYNSGRTILGLYPKYEDRLTHIYIEIARVFDLPYDDQLSFFDNLWSQLGIRSRVSLMTLSFSNHFITFLKDAFMVILFTVFLLLEAVFFMRKLDLAFERKRAGQMKKISVDIAAQISRYLSIKFLISLVTGVVVTIGLRLVGLEFAVVWGIIQFILNFIPNLGSIACGAGATLFALLQFWPAPGPVILVALIMLGANLIIGSVMEPKIMGDNLGLSPIVVLLALLVWGYLWGFAGMILAVPMMVIIKIFCENIEMLEPVSILLSSQKAITAKSKRQEESPPAPSPTTPDR